MKTTINFSIKGQHENHLGSAMVGFVTTGIYEAAIHFDFNPAIKRNMIGSQIIEGLEYRVFENYVDSGSDDYFYFAVEIVN